MKWSEEDLKYLFDNYLNRTPLELSTDLDRTVRSIEIKINRSGKSLNERKWETIVCKNCEKEFKSLKTYESKFCSKSCSAKLGNLGREVKKSQRDKISKTLISRNSPFKKERPNCKICGKKCKNLINIYCSRECLKNDNEYRKSHSQRMKQRFLDFPELHPNRLCAGIKESYPETFLTNYLIENNLEEDVHYKKQYKVENYYVDFFFPKSNIVIEVDGERWHNPSCPREIKRENKIKENYNLYRFKVKPLLNKEYTEIINNIIEESLC